MCSNAPLAHSQIILLALLCYKTVLVPPVLHPMPNDIMELHHVFMTSLAIRHELMTSLETCHVKIGIITSYIHDVMTWPFCSVCFSPALCTVHPAHRMICCFPPCIMNFVPCLIFLQPALRGTGALWWLGLYALHSMMYVIMILTYVPWCGFYLSQ